MAEVSTTEAARMLGVTRQHVDALLGEGKIDGRMLDSHRWLVNTSSIRQYETLRKGAGRSWSAKAAWAVLDILDGKTPAMTATLKHRIVDRIHRCTAEQIGQRVASRVTAHRYSAEDRNRVAAQLALTGRSAAADITELSPQRRIVEGYLRGSATLEAFATKHLLLPDPDGDVIIYTGAEDRYADSKPGPAVIAADLIRSTNARERSAGITTLERLRAKWLATPTA